MENLGKISEFASNQLGPPIKEQVCDKGIKPGKADWPWLTKQIPTFFKAIRKCGADVPPWNPKPAKLGEQIMAKCVKPSHNFCKVEDIKEVKGCATGKALGWAMMNMDMLNYLDKRHCRKLVECLTKKKTWAVGKRLVEKYAKYKEGQKPEDHLDERVSKSDPAIQIIFGSMLTFRQDFN